MVGVKTWEDEQIALILACKAEGKKVAEIITELKKRWPRKQIKDSGVRYVMTNYKDIPETQAMAGGSKSRSSRGTGGHASQKRAHLKETKQAKSTARPAPKTKKLRTKPPQSPPSPQMNYAARMRKISGGPLEATFASPQSFKILKDRVPSTTKLLTHARQAQDIGINAIEFGAKVPAPPEDEPVMAHPAPYRPATVPQAHAIPVGAFGQQGMNRTVGMPPMGPGNHFGAMGQQDMRMIGQQHPQMASMHMGPPRPPGARGHYPQIRGHGQQMGLYQGPFEGMGSNMSANLDGKLGPPYGYDPYYVQMPPPQTPQQNYYQSPLNYGPDGAMAGIMPRSVQFGQLYPGQVANSVNNGQYRPAVSPMQCPNPAMAGIDPSLDPRLFNDASIMNTQQTATAMNSAGRTPSRTGSTSTPQPNRLPQSTTQGTQNGPTGTPGTNHPANAVVQENPNSAATPRGNRLASAVAPEPQNGKSATPQINRPANVVAQEPQLGATATISRPASSTAQLPRDKMSAAPETNLPSCISAGVRTGKIIITLNNPSFDEPFSFPSSNEGWSVFLNQHMKIANKNQPVPADSFSRVSKGDFEVRFINPVFRKGFVWKSAQEASGESTDQAKSASPGVKTDLDPPNSSKPNEGLSMSRNGPSRQINDLAKPQTARKEPVIAGPAQAKPTLEPKTPSTKVAPSLALEKPPSLSSLRLTESEGTAPDAIKRLVSMPKMGDRNPTLGPQDMKRSASQLSDSNSTKINSPQTGKRTAPMGEEEVSPSKRHKTVHQNAQHPGAPPVSLPKTGMGSSNLESMKQHNMGSGNLPESTSSLMQNSAEHPSFAAAVAQLPVPSPSQLLPPAEDKSIRQSQAQNYVPPRPFNPRPSQPLNNFNLFQAQSPQQYSAAMAKRAAGELEKFPSHAFVNFPNGNGIPAGILPFLQDGLPSQQQSQEQKQNQSVTNAAEAEQKQQQNQDFDIDAMVANNQQPQQQQDQDFDFGFDANFADGQYQVEDPFFSVFGPPNNDLDRILGLDSTNTAYSPPTSPSLFPPSPDPAFDLLSNLPSKPPSPNPDPNGPNSIEYAAWEVGMSVERAREVLEEYPSPGPWRAGSNASEHSRMLAEYQEDGGDFGDVLDLEGGDPVRKVEEVDMAA